MWCLALAQSRSAPNVKANMLFFPNAENNVRLVPISMSTQMGVRHAFNVPKNSMNK